MIRSPVSTADGRIRATIERYQETFNAEDRAGWLALFVDEAILEDPVGSTPREGLDGLSAFWDEIHHGDANAGHRTVRMVQGPQVCGLEAAWAFELQIARADRTVVVEIIDQAVFTGSAQIRQLRAFWSEATLRVEE